LIEEMRFEVNHSQYYIYIYIYLFIYLYVIGFITAFFTSPECDRI